MDGARVLGQDAAGDTRLRPLPSLAPARHFRVINLRVYDFGIRIDGDAVAVLQ